MSELQLPSVAEFPGWLETVVKQFSSLEQGQQTTTLNQG